MSYKKHTAFQHYSLFSSPAWVSL